MINKIYNFHDLLYIQLKGKNGDFIKYCETEFSHAKQIKNEDKKENVQQIILSLKENITTEGTVWALGKGLFYNKKNDIILISENNSLFFNPSDIYASVPNIFEHLNQNLKVDVKLKLNKNNKIENIMRKLFDIIFKIDPRTKDEIFAEKFISEFIEPLIYRSFLQKGYLLLHAAGLVKNNIGILVFGSQNIGKTTITLGMSKRGWYVLGDDMCLLDKNGNLKSYTKPIKLENEYLRTDRFAQNYFFSDKLKNKPLRLQYYKLMNKKIKRFEFKIPTYKMGIKTTCFSKIDCIIFLQRKSEIECDKAVTIESISSQDSTTLAQQYIADEFDANKRVDRDIRHAMAIYKRYSGDFSLLTSKAKSIIKEAFKNKTSYILTMTKPDASTLDDIEDIKNSLT